jgi:hypothetical protein
MYMTEFGFETNPPDPFSGVPLERQAAWNQLGERLAFENPRIASQTQFLLRDVAPVAGTSARSKAHWFTYQSGLYFQNDTPKPAANAYYFPFLVDGGSYWGQLRFRPNALPPGVQDSVQIQWQSAGGGDWVNIGDPVLVTNAMGYFGGQTSVPGPGQLRAVWTQAPVTSLPQPVG